MREVEILKKKQLKCYLYTRVSTSMQVDGYSLDAQRDKLRKYAAYEDMIVAGEYSDEGFSGKNIQGRQEFQRMLNDIQDGKDDVSYVLVFKLSRFGRNAADVLNSLQLMQDFGVNLICVEDGIDSSKDAGKLMISVLSAVAEIERENIRTQTMAGWEQKAREGKWNGGFAPYGYKLDNGELVIAEDEAEVIRVIYDRYIHTNEGVAGVAKYLNRNGYTKKLRQNNTIPGFSRDFVKNVLYNPVYMGKIAYGRRRTEKKQGTRNEMHVVEQSEFPVYEGQHEAIISEEDWYLAQEKRKVNSFKREKVNNPDHAHILSGGQLRALLPMIIWKQWRFSRNGYNPRLTAPEPSCQSFLLIKPCSQRSIVFLTTIKAISLARSSFSMPSRNGMNISTLPISLSWQRAATVQQAAEVRRCLVLALPRAKEPDGKGTMCLGKSSPNVCPIGQKKPLPKSRGRKKPRSTRI